MGNLTAYTSFNSTPELKARLRRAACKEQRSVGAYLRYVLHKILPELPSTREYEIELTLEEAALLAQRGYLIEPLGA